MATDGQTLRSGSASRWTLFLWGGAALLLSLPFFAMQMQAPGVDWSAGDFVVMGVMLVLVCGAIELAVRKTGNRSYRFGAASAIAGAFLIIWANLAVGIVGSEHNDANLLFFGALLIGLASAIVARFRARGMAFAMLITFGAVAVAFGIAALGATDEANVSHLREAIATSVISSPFLLASFLFRRAAAAR